MPVSFPVVLWLKSVEIKLKSSFELSLTDLEKIDVSNFFSYFSKKALSAYSSQIRVGLKRIPATARRGPRLSLGDSTNAMIS